MLSDEEKLVSALRKYADGGTRPEFPFDDLKFTLEFAADTIARGLVRESDALSKGGEE